MQEILLGIATWGIPVLLAITLHEVAHGWAALAFGDRTAQMLGRLSLNPLKHIDPIGTIAVPLLLVISSSLAGMSPLVFGWAKAVPININNLPNPRVNMAWIALAGPASNFLQALAWVLLLRINFDGFTDAIQSIALAGLSINLVLIALNILPIPPLDGSRVVAAFLSKPLAYQYDKLEPYGFFILIGLMLMNWLTPIIAPIFNAVKFTVFWLVGIY
ncbi:MAG: site-2 protease family protein [Thiotrichales bacterium]|jgi:Zn-dependent protease|nr:site-2 protease family protein [Thiotrichales bacterium]